jgi:hypothetical protein
MSIAQRPHEQTGSTCCLGARQAGHPARTDRNLRCVAVRQGHPAGDTFIVGYDERGNLVELPAVADGPDFLRTVHFDRVVLEPYYGDPNKYRVRDGLVQGPTWTIPIYNDHPDRVIAYLGDLGKLPLFEQKRWKPHNIEPDGTLSETAFRRDVLAEFADGTGPVWRLVAAREKANEAFRSRYGVPCIGNRSLRISTSKGPSASLRTTRSSRSTES